MTVREVIEQVIDDLGKIKVEVNQMEDIGLPVAKSVSGLKMVLAAWDEEEKDKDKTDEPVLRIEPCSPEEQEALEKGQEQNG